MLSVRSVPGYHISPFQRSPNCPNVNVRAALFKPPMGSLLFSQTWCPNLLHPMQQEWPSFPDCSHGHPSTPNWARRCQGLLRRTCTGRSTDTFGVRKTNIIGVGVIRNTIQLHQTIACSAGKSGMSALRPMRHLILNGMRCVPILALWNQNQPSAAKTSLRLWEHQPHHPSSGTPLLWTSLPPMTQPRPARAGSGVLFAIKSQVAAVNHG